jgi:hypothetical protein
MNFPLALTQVVSRTIGISLVAQTSRYRSWPWHGNLVDAPLALAETRTSGLRRIYANGHRDAWDGPAVFRDAVEKHGGIQLAPEKRAALVHPLTMLMWGELGAWIVSAELAERLEDPDARLAASSQVFDEARHFYTLRDYVTLLHVPVPELDPYFRLAVRRLLCAKGLELKLLAMQILAEGAAQAIFRFLADADVEPVLTELLPYIEKDEARHVGLGILTLPERLSRLGPRRCRRLSSRVGAIGDLFLAAQLRYLAHYRALGLDPSDLVRRSDKLLYELSRKLGNVPGTDQPYFRTEDPNGPGYEERMAQLFPPAGARPSASARILRGVIDFGARTLPS